MYYAQAWYLVQEGQKLYEDDIEAWVHGPTIPHMYRQYKKYEFKPITDKNIKSRSLKIDSKIRRFLKNIWKLYGNYDANYLELLTHQEKPWILAREKFIYRYLFKVCNRYKYYKRFLYEPIKESTKRAREIISFTLTKLPKILKKLVVFQERLHTLP